MKTLRRQVLISERDYLRLRGRAQRLYDRVSWQPVTCAEIEHQYLLEVLRSPTGLNTQPPDLERPARYLGSIGSRLYNAKYPLWSVWRGEDDRVWLRSRGNARASCLGWARFEKDFELAGEST